MTLLLLGVLILFTGLSVDIGAINAGGGGGGGAELSAIEKSSTSTSFNNLNGRS